MCSMLGRLYSVFRRSVLTRHDKNPIRDGFVTFVVSFLLKLVEGDDFDDVTPRVAQIDVTTYLRAPERPSVPPTDFKHSRRQSMGLTGLSVPDHGLKI